MMHRFDAREIVEFAKRNGASSAGCIRNTNFKEYLEEVRRRPEYRDVNYRRLESFEKAAQAPAHLKTLIVLVVDYFIDSPPAADDKLRVSSYSRACWPGVGFAMDRMCGFLKSKGFLAEGVDVPARAAAAKAGLGFIGRNTLFYAHGAGSYIGIGVVGSDVDVENLPKPGDAKLNPACERCGICAKSCPTGAIEKDGCRINPLKCISFLNRHPEEPGKILPESPGSLRGWLHGCEICQENCPVNKGAKHGDTPVLNPELNLYGMKLPNKAVFSKEDIRAKLGEIQDRDYLAYVKFLLGK